MLQPLWKTVWWFFKKLEIALPDDPAILFLGYPQRIKSNLQEILCTHVLSSVIDNSEKVEGAQVSMNGQVDKQNEAYTYSGMVFSLEEGSADTGYDVCESGGHYSK